MTREESEPLNSVQVYRFPYVRPENWLDSVFGNRAKIALVRLMALEPARVWTAREAARKLGVSPATTNEAAKALRDAGILDFQKVGASHGIRIRDDTKVGRLVVGFFDQEHRATNEWRQAIAAAVPAGTACYLYGSTARETAERGSDVDVLIVARSQDEAEETAARVRAAANRIIPSPLEIIALDRQHARRAKDSPLLRSVRKEGIPLTSTRLEAVL